MSVLCDNNYSSSRYGVSFLGGNWSGQRVLSSIPSAEPPSESESVPVILETCETSYSDFDVIYSLITPRNLENSVSYLGNSISSLGVG